MTQPKPATKPPEKETKPAEKETKPGVPPDQEESEEVAAHQRATKSAAATAKDEPPPTAKEQVLRIALDMKRLAGVMVTPAIPDTSHQAKALQEDALVLEQIAEAEL